MNHEAFFSQLRKWPQLKFKSIIIEEANDQYHIYAVDINYSGGNRLWLTALKSESEAVALRMKMIGWLRQASSIQRKPS